jgi:hypothetical protein
MLNHRLIELIDGVFLKSQLALQRLKALFPFCWLHDLSSSCGAAR